MLKRYIKSSVAISTLFTSHQVFAATCSYSGDTTITADCNGGTISDSDSTITINAGVTIDLTASFLTVNDGIDITAFINNGTISGGTYTQNFRAYRSNDIGSFTNNGTVTLNGTQSFYIYNNNSDPGNHGTFTNTGTWNSNGTQSFYAAQATSWTSFTNSGSFTANGVQSFYITGSGGSIGTLSNSGTFTTNGNSSFYLGTGYTISSFDNSGTWALGASGAALYGTITTLTNTGTISGTLKNLGTITTFNNDQGSIGSPVAFDSRLPTNYNIIINSTSDYGKIAFSAPSGTMNFGITSGSTVAESQTYSSVIDGLTSAHLNSTSGTFTDSSNSQTYNWTLSNSSANLWDLVFSECTNCYPSTASTQTTINNISYSISAQMASFAMTTNFANLNTYDCGLFDATGGCFSIGGRFTDVNANNNSDSDSSAIVMVGGYKINNHVRIAGFADQMINNNSPSGIDMGNKSPMLGLSLVWNQHPDHLGYQVKLANAYQDKDVTITRAATGDAEAGSGNTDASVISYIAEVSYQFLSNDNTAYRPYFAGRYAKIKQDGYTENNVDNPLTYSTVEDESVTLIMGMKFKHAFSPEIFLNGSLGIEHDIHNDVDNLSVTATNISGLSPVSVNSNINKTRGVASLGADYYLAKNQMLSLKTQFQELAYTHTNAKTAYLSYTIGF